MKAKTSKEAQNFGRFDTWFGIVFALSVAFSAFAADTLVLHEEAFVKGPTVRLGDVADIEGENAGILASIEVGSAAAPGNSKQLNASLVEARLRTAGVDLRNVEIKGARSVHATTSSFNLTKEMIAQSLKDHIAQVMPWTPENAEIDVPLPTQDLVVPDGEVELTWRSSPEYRFLGSGAFRGVLMVDGHEERSILCKANVNAYGDILAAATDIPRGRIISLADLETRKISLISAPAAAILDPKEIVGLVARRTIFPGQLITSKDVEARLVVKRNQVVLVEIKSGAVFVRTRAKALANGRAGDLIVCANLSSEEQFQGLVRADGVIVVP